MNGERRDLIIQVCAVLSLICLLIYTTRVDHFEARHLWVVAAILLLLAAILLRWGGTGRRR